MEQNIAHDIDHAVAGIAVDVAFIEHWKNGVASTIALAAAPLDASIELLTIQARGMLEHELDIEKICRKALIMMAARNGRTLPDTELAPHVLGQVLRSPLGGALAQHLVDRTSHAARQKAAEVGRASAAHFRSQGGALGDPGIGMPLPSHHVEEGRFGGGYPAKKQRK